MYVSRVLLLFSLQLSLYKAEADAGRAQAETGGSTPTPSTLHDRGIASSGSNMVAVAVDMWWLDAHAKLDRSLPIRSSESARLLASIARCWRGWLNVVEVREAHVPRMRWSRH